MSSVAASGTTPPDERQDTRRSRLAGLSRLRFVGVGLVGQVLTLAAMVIPILAREGRMVFVLVFATAVAGLVVDAAMLAYPYLYPVVRGPRMARVATAVSLVSLAVVSSAVALGTPLEDRLGMPAGTFAAAGLLTATWGSYSIVVTRLVRAGDTAGLGLSRVFYGVAVLLTVLVVVLVDVGPLGLTLATALAYVLAGAALALRRSHWTPRPAPLSAASRRRLRRAYLRRTVRPAAARLANGWTTLLPGLALPGLGAAAEPWSVVTRICGGFATVMMAVLSPPLDARLSRAVRERDRAGFTAARRAAVLLGLVMAALGVFLSLELAAHATSGEVDEWLLPVAVATVLFWGSLLATTSLNRLPNFLRRDSARLVWDVVRAALLSVAFLATEGTDRLIAMGVVLAVSAVALVPLTRWPTRA
ncbi:hypothetical protein [Blastococcus sp. TF02A-35]|uniref:hypothetical protein n=1 Tax=Blastococcus sp. TF02A-35 TaxID=2559612 RepID=UPI0010740A3C|nr:hypothetical protein [Blastococcus sp. TF02A_35]TFV53695.1 hypothetical protein E4P43_00095 [Blastococcus sp. TF02A_35]